MNDQGQGTPGDVNAPISGNGGPDDALTATATVRLTLRTTRRELTDLLSRGGSSEPMRMDGGALVFADTGEPVIFGYAVSDGWGDLVQAAAERALAEVGVTKVEVTMGTARVEPAG